MKASELIKELLDSILEHGDLVVADDCCLEIFMVYTNKEETNCGIEGHFFQLETDKS